MWNTRKKKYIQIIFISFARLKINYFSFKYLNFQIKLHLNTINYTKISEKKLNIFFYT